MGIFLLQKWSDFMAAGRRMHALPGQGVQEFVIHPEYQPTLYRTTTTFSAQKND